MQNHDREKFSLRGTVLFKVVKPMYGGSYIGKAHEISTKVTMGSNPTPGRLLQE